MPGISRVPGIARVWFAFRSCGCNEFGARILEAGYVFRRSRRPCRLACPLRVILLDRLERRPGGSDLGRRFFCVFAKRILSSRWREGVAPFDIFLTPRVQRSHSAGASLPGDKCSMPQRSTPLLFTPFTLRSCPSWLKRAWFVVARLGIARLLRTLLMLRVRHVMCFFFPPRF